MSALRLYVWGLIIVTPCKNCQGGAIKFRLASLATSHPPDQKSETAPDIKQTLCQNLSSTFVLIDLDFFL